jgi:hypothetical protein
MRHKITHLRHADSRRYLRSAQQVQVLFTRASDRDTFNQMLEQA